MVLNKRHYLFLHDATTVAQILVPKFASGFNIFKSSEGYWINVYWNSGIIAPLTYQEEAQALGEENAEGSTVS